MRTSLFTHKCLPSIQKIGVWLLAYGLSLRRLSFSVFFFATLVVFSFFPYFSSAQIEAPSETRASQASGAASGLQNFNTMSQSAGGSGVATLPPAQQANAPAQPAKEDKDLIDKAKEVASTVTAITNLPEKILNFFTTLFLSVASALLYVAGMAFESTLEFLVFGMGELIQNKTGLGNAIDTMWRLIRDIANIIFIYAFVYIGIMLIVDPDKVSVKQLLARTIIGALLINFSLFFVKFIIDFANFTTLQIFNAFTTGSGSISAKVTDMLGVGTLMNPGSADRFADLTGGGMFWFFILGGILILIVAFVFFAATFMMMSRFVGLVVIMIASPILFAGTIFSGTQSFASYLWKKLISYAFYAPAFLLLILIAITLLSGLGTEIVPNGVKLGDALLPGNAKPPTKDMFAVIVNFFVVIFFFIQALHLADKMGLAGADMAVKIAGGLTVGLTAKMGRAVIGRKAHEWSEDDKLKDKASQAGFGGWAARQRLKAYRGVGDSSFDVRNTGVNEMLKEHKLGLGEGTKGGYKAKKKEVEDKEMKFAKSLGEIDDDDSRVSIRKKQAEAARKELNVNRDKLRDRIKAGDTSAYDELQSLEKAVSEAEKNYNQEKNRRVLGGTFTGEEIQQAKRNLAVSQETIQAQQAAIARMTSQLNSLRNESGPQEDQVFLQEEIKKATDTLIAAHRASVAASQHASVEANAGGGYAHVLTSNTQFSRDPASWGPALWSAAKVGAQGRLVAQEKAAGEAMEKAYTKKVKKSKEEKDKDALLEAVKEKNESK